MTTSIKNSIHVLHAEDNLIYRIDSLRELGSSGLGFLYTLELVAGYDYINPDYSNAQGYVGKDNFVDDVHSVDFTVYPLEESLGERLKEEGFEVINIKDYTIHN